MSHDSRDPAKLGFGPPEDRTPPENGELTLADLQYPDALEARVRTRASETEERAAQVRAAVRAELRRSFTDVKALLFRRILQCFQLFNDVCMAFLGKGSVAVTAARKQAAVSAETARENAEIARELAGSYMERFQRRLSGGVLIYRLEKTEEGYRDRTAFPAYRRDAQTYLSMPQLWDSGIVIGRFDRCRGYWRGQDLSERGLRITVLRRPDGDLFRIRGVDDDLPLLPAREALIVLARYPGKGAFEIGAIMPGLIAAALNSELNVEMASDLASRFKKLARAYLRVRDERNKLRGLIES